ncbi:MAG: DUF92 domain-containing protein [Sphaerochaetaceae bacterium]
MRSPFTPLLIAIGVNLALAVIAWLWRLLTITGALMAILVGVVVFYFLGLGGWILLFLFFLTANILGRLSRSVVDASMIQKKGGRRDWAQVAANGILAGGAALYYGLGGGVLALVMFGSSVAAATADTWASEAGILSKIPPVSIRTFTPVPKGMSGGITWLGTFSSLLGSVIIAMGWYATFGDYREHKWLFLASIIAFAGIVGSLADSFLGATVQGHYWDAVNKRPCEHEELNGVKLELCRGIRWIDNDVVNFLSNAIAVALAGGLSLLFL